MKIKISALAIIIFVVLFGGIYSSDLVGLWKTEASKTVRTIPDGSGEGQKNPGDIKGSFTFLDISNNFDIPVKDLQTAFGIKTVENVEAFRCKDLEPYYGENLSNEIGTGSVKMFVALYKGIEYELEEETYLPESAVIFLKEKGNLSKENLEYIETHIVNIYNK